MTPIPLDFVFALSEAGYPTDLLYRTGIGRINDVKNTAAGVPAPGDVERDLQAKIEIENLASALTYSEGTGRRLSLARMVWAGLVQTKGFEDRLCSRM